MDKLWTGNLEKEFVRYIPIPHGDYALYTEWTTNEIPHASIKVYFKIFEK